LQFLERGRSAYIIISSYVDTSKIARFLGKAKQRVVEREQKDSKKTKADSREEGVELAALWIIRGACQDNELKALHAYSSAVG
jgi:hypothetical protein